MVPRLTVASNFSGLIDKPVKRSIRTVIGMYRLNSHQAVR